MISYKCNGGRLGENISFIYGVFKFCKINDLPFDNICLDINYKNNNLLKKHESESVFRNNIEMFSNILYVFETKIDYNNTIEFNLNGKSDPAKLYDFFKYNNLNNDSKIIFSDYWSLQPYWCRNDIDYELLDYICRPKNLMNRLYNQYKNILKKSLAIHVRRGDFKCIVNKSLMIDNLSYDLYFNNGKKIYNIDELKELILNNSLNYSNILIFSDDINWCKINLKIINNIKFIENNKPYEDMILMSMCDNIIVNPGSFFSLVSYILARLKI